MNAIQAALAVSFALSLVPMLNEKGLCTGIKTPKGHGTLKAAKK